MEEIKIEEERHPPRSIRKPFRLRPAQIIVLGFLLVIFTGAFLLCLPVSTASGKWLNFLSALFTSTSAVCVTGLTLFPIVEMFNGFGQAVLLILIQAGGLGFMTLSTMLMLILKRKITLKDRIAIQEALNQHQNKGIVKLTINILLMTAVIEGIGIALLLPYLVFTNGPIGIWQSVFTAISAFCNAGFDIFGSTSLIGYAGNVVICLTLCMMIILGGLGFTVISDVLRNKFRFSKLSLHSKVVVIVTGSLIVLGFVSFFLLEFSASMRNLKPGEKILASFFQSVTTRTAGFNTVDQNALSPAGKTVSMFLMFIGASPTSTGGGIKTSTFAILLIMMLAGLKGGEGDIEVFKKSINAKNCLKAVAVIIISFAIVIALALFLMVSEKNTVPAELLTSENIFFEAFSAFGTVGVTCGITPYLSPAGQIAIMLVMFFGRIGPLTIGMLFVRNHGKVQMRYPEGNIMIG